MNLIQKLLRVVGGFALQLGVTLILALFHRDIAHPMGGLAEGLISLGLVLLWFATAAAFSVILSTKSE